MTTVARSDEPIVIQARRVRFDWSDTPSHWIPGDPQTTHTINVLHLLLPAGERWFNHVFRKAIPLVDDPQLLADMRGFIGQESVHSRSHQKVQEHLADQGLDCTPFVDRIEWMFEHLLGDDPLGHRFPLERSPRVERGWLQLRVAVIAALEHFTAVMGDWALDAEALDEAGADPVMMDLLRWHGAEEVEHRSVAFDLAQYLGNPYPLRAASMLGTTAILAPMWVAGVRFFMQNDPTNPGSASWAAYRSAGEHGRLPRFADLMGAVPRYLRRSFHPSLEGSTARAREYLAVSPGVHPA